MQRKRGIRRPRRQHKSNLPSTYIHDIETIQPGTKVVIWCRVSKCQQKSRGNNADQETDLHTAVEARGGTVVDVVLWVGRASNGNADAGLYDAANRAARAGAVLLAESTSRYARHPRYHSQHRPHLVAGMIALRDLRWVCGDVMLVTLLDPDATWKEERAHQSKRGQRRKGNTGGRPNKPCYKKRRRERLLPQVRQLYDEGMSYRAIARTVGTHERNVRRWVRRFLCDGGTDKCE